MLVTVALSTTLWNILALVKMSEIKAQQQDPEMKGWLYKWTNYLKGYQKRWFVLSNGLLSYYRNQAEMAHTCRGTITLVSAVIHTEDTCHFVISNSGTQTFHLKAANEIERQSWVTALELAKARAIRVMELEDDEVYDMDPNQPDTNELHAALRALGEKLEHMNNYNDLIAKHGAALQRSLSEVEQLNNIAEVPGKIKAINEKALHFKKTLTGMLNVCSEFFQLAQKEGHKWQKLLQHEHEQRLRFEEMVEQIAKQHSHLEEAAKEASVNSPGGHSDEDEFYDAQESTPATTEFIVTIPSKCSRKVSTSYSLQVENQDLHDVSSDTETEIDHNGEQTGVMTCRVKSNTRDADNAIQGLNSNLNSNESGPRIPSFIGQDSSFTNNIAPLSPVLTRRTKIQEKPNYSLNLWAIMKNCIGKDLSKIPMPVNFNEPISTLQRLTEEYEYAELLDKAAQCSDSCEQLTYIAAYAVSAYASTSNRTGKPFNPLLGETYECDRTADLGWRCISEQVSHHPPMLAQYCEGREWCCWQEFYMSSKFRGRYLQVTPLGTAHLVFANSGHHYTWHKITTMVNNIIVGKLWVDHQGKMEIFNHVTREKCHLDFVAYSIFSRETPRKVTGFVTNSSGVPQWVLQGTWDGKMEAARVLNSQGSEQGQSVVETDVPKVLWKRVIPGPEYEKMYSFTVLTCQLNEPEEGVAPTDSRLRPDQRLMEQGNWDEANSIKIILEEKQREARRQREHEAELAAREGRPYIGYEPVWFKKMMDSITGNPIHMYKGQYWECKANQDWSMCPKIYL